MSLLDEMRKSLKADIDKRNAFVAELTEDEFTAEREAELKGMDEAVEAKRARVADLAESEERAAAAARVAPAAPGVVTHEANPVYRKDNPTGASFFRDLFNARAKGDPAAVARLAQSQERALSTSAGAGGEFAPPLWLVEDFVELARPGRVAADSVSHDALPEGVASVNLPAVASGTATAIQSTQNSALQQTDLTTSSVSSGIATIGGKQIVSLQLLAQSGIPFDRIVLGDLARDYAVQLDKQVLNGTGSSGQLKGILNTSGINAVTFTNASPTFIGTGMFYSQFINAISNVAQNRYLQPTVALMHPRRWAWVLAQFDSSNRPLVVPSGPYLNAPAEGSTATAQGPAGTLAGMPVLVDPNIPTNLGAGTNQDPVIVMRADDLWLFESPLQSASFDATYADQASILFRVLGFSAFIPNRYPKSISVVNGTGMVTPSF